MYIPGTTRLHILLAHPCLYYYLLSPQYTVLHILVLHILLLIFSYYFILFLPIFIYILLCYVYFFALSIERTCLIYISLLIISCIIEYVTNKRTLKLEGRLTIMAFHVRASSPGCFELGPKISPSEGGSSTSSSNCRNRMSGSESS